MRRVRCVCVWVVECVMVSDTCEMCVLGRRGCVFVDVVPVPDTLAT